MRFSTISTNENQKSTVQYGEPDFPFLLFHDDFMYYRDNCINWHWHGQLEFAVVLSGGVEYHVGQRQFELHEGEGVFINANNLHMEKALPGMMRSTKMFSVAFSPELLAPAVKGRIYHKYILPYISNPAFQMLCLSDRIPWQKEVLSYIIETCTLDELQPYGYEMKIHNALFNAWQEMVLNIDKKDLEVSTPEVLSQERLRTMMVFVSRNYMKPISLEDIAASANISKSTCYRCFQNCLKMAPLEYLKDYRLDNARLLLFKDSEKSVTDIASECGFDNVSYFIQAFKKKTGKTPLSYRKTPGTDNKRVP